MSGLTMACQVCIDDLLGLLFSENPVVVDVFYDLCRDYDWWIFLIELCQRFVTVPHRQDWRLGSRSIFLFFTILLNLLGQLFMVLFVRLDFLFVVFLKSILRVLKVLGEVDPSLFAPLDLVLTVFFCLLGMSLASSNV